MISNVGVKSDVCGAVTDYRLNVDNGRDTAGGMECTGLIRVWCCQKII